MRWLLKLLPSSPPPLPVLLRIRSAEPPDVVEIEALWSSGRRTRRQLRTAAGLCVMPWMADERSVQLDVRTDAGRTRLALQRDRSDGGRVHDLSLDGPPLH
ncbi:MAG: hypothetical protein AB8I08_02625 [Sandaracinaceae bacterium]